MLKLLLIFAFFGFISASNVERRRGALGMGGYGRLRPRQLEELMKYSNSFMDSSDGEEDSIASALSAAIKTERYHRVLPIQDEDAEIGPHIIKADKYKHPISLIYKTETPSLKVKQMHKKGKPTIEETESEEEPTRVTHKVFRPVIQEIKEIIQPYRRIKQEVRPVLEEARTLVSERDGDQESKEEQGESERGYGKKQSRPKMRIQYKEESSSSEEDNSNDNKKKMKYMTEMDSPDRQSKEMRKYSRSRQESSDEEDSDKEELYKLLEQQMRSSSLYDDDSKSDDSNLYKEPENDSSNRRSKESRKYSRSRQESSGEDDSGKEETYKRQSQQKMRSSPLYDDESKSESKSNSYKQSENDSSNQRSKETRRYINRSRQESSGDDESDKTESYKRPLPLKISNYGEQSKSDDSSKVRYMTVLENDSSNQKPKYPAKKPIVQEPRNIQYSDDMISVLKNMNNLMGGDLKMKASDLIGSPMLNLNAGTIKLIEQSSPLYSGNLELSDYSSGY